MRTVVAWAPFRLRRPTPGRSGWPRRSRPSRWSWPDGWAPSTGHSRSRPGCRPRSRWHSGQAGIPVIGLWARVPHYVSAMPYPEASAALIEGLCAVTGAVLDSSALRAAGEASRRQVDELIGANPEHLEMVRRLEAALDSEEVSPMGLDVEVPERRRDRGRAGAVPQRRRALRSRPPATAGRQPGRGCGPGARRRRRRTPGTPRSPPPGPSTTHGLERRRRDRLASPAPGLRRSGRRTRATSVAARQRGEGRKLGHDLAHLVDGGGLGQLAAA